MNRVVLVVIALTGLSAGALGADTLVPRAGRAMLLDPMLLLTLTAVALALTAVVLYATRRPAANRAASHGGEFIRRRVQALAADGATPERIARDTGLPRDVVMMALRASDDLPQGSAGTAASAGTPLRRPRLPKPA
jgi:hypothetical protein